MADEILFSRLDYAFARFLTQRSYFSDEQSTIKASFTELVLSLSYAQSQGHSCIVLTDQETRIIHDSGLASECGDKPLVLEDKTLYLQRYWAYECQLAEKIKLLRSVTYLHQDVELALECYFPKRQEVDWQRLAAKAVVSQSFTIITGGPGTGKTTTVVKILALLQTLAQHPLKMALITPTGKAAKRLQESIGQHKQGLPCSDAIKAHIPEKVVTIHRLLGSKQPSPYFKYNDKQRLPYDIVVVDESSMIDLALMSKLMCALKANARLILLGDKDQLASVETGMVLADLSVALPDCTQELKKSYRFTGKIKQLAAAINTQAADEAWAILSENTVEVGLLKTELITYISDQYMHYLQLMIEKANFKEIYTAFNTFQVLCATRKGPLSVEDINSGVVDTLKRRGVISPKGEWYAGRPIMITQNDSVLQLYNGDIGICLVDSENKRQLMVFFLLPDGRVNAYLPARLSYCETVFSMTIHKSQGSEFKEVLLVLPDRINPILTKELVYTGITRAKKALKVLTEKTIFLDALARKVDRNSGLAERISKMY